ncbi:MAG: hypothetical protein OdinLCB4_002215 [Candidatus Odinarchaeum yellowstonii]|uniref:B-block binding subunit of TFIIIC domain-containing protein n=1 Tax=Odinarchaeota yellowstonii (strain LCB_4) TaxID=1841599 RepID=A0AAF0D326_ODILC|nr:MAG: hypothetical protein OdinLCB4_002215 [Candidatus Odinarchaeum yellowstonii]
MVTDLEKKALKIIRESGEAGLPQNELWKSLNTTSREGHRISSKLERNGYIRRVKELYKGRWTYRLFPVVKTEQSVKYDKLDNCPCFDCEDLTKCGVGNDINPILCIKQNNWLRDLEKQAGSERENHA